MSLDICATIRDNCIRNCNESHPISTTRIGCLYNCTAMYAACVTGHAVPRMIDDVVTVAADVTQWLQDHPEVVVGTVLVVTIIMVVVAGPGGVLIAVAA